MNHIPSRPLSFLAAYALLVALATPVQAEQKTAQVAPPAAYDGPSVLLSQFPEPLCTRAAQRQLEIPLHGSFNICLMIFEEDGGDLYESRASIRVNEKTIALTRSSKASPTLGQHGGPRNVSRYRSATEGISVELDVETINDNCSESTDSCCGAYYEGTLTVVAKRQKTSYPVYYYRGG